MGDETSAHIADPKRRMLVNARGAVSVVHTTSTTVDDQLETIVDQAESQAAEMEGVVEEVGSLSASIEEIAASAAEVSDRSERAVERATAGEQSATTAMDRMADAEAVMGDVAGELQRLTDRIGAIESALAGIDDIAAQTNMLALNASIEAARASEGSDGFAVVAEEIKSLAEQSQSQAQEIDSTLSEVRDAADSTVTELETAQAEIETSTTEVGSAVEQLGAVTDAVEKTAQDVAAISETTEEQATVSETVAHSCEQAADRAEQITGQIETIDDIRTEQTAMLTEIDDALASATPAISVDDVDRIPMGVPALDSLTDGGLLLGGQSVIRYDDVDVDDIVAGLCAGAVADGYAVSVMPTPTLDRSTLAEAFSARNESLGAVLDTNRLFVLDAFDEWQSSHNVFDMGSQTLSEINRETATRRDAPLLIVGNIAGEIRVLGEETAREARYENDSSVFEPTDTVCNVVDDGRVDSAFAAFYAGGADQVVRVSGTDGSRELELLRAPDSDRTTNVLDASGGRSTTPVAQE